LFKFILFIQVIWIYSNGLTFSFSNSFCENMPTDSLRQQNLDPSIDLYSICSRHILFCNISQKIMATIMQVADHLLYKRTLKLAKATRPCDGPGGRGD
jgi:hypothetical protein